jgi:hypothetical protein
VIHYEDPPKAKLTDNMFELISHLYKPRKRVGEQAAVQYSVHRSDLVQHNRRFAVLQY